MTKPEFVSVPRVPPEAMLVALDTARSGERMNVGMGMLETMYAAMLAAAPSPEPRAVEAFDNDLPDMEFRDGEWRSIKRKPAPQSAPAPLTEDERADLNRLYFEQFNKGFKLTGDAIGRALAIADHYKTIKEQP
jgi:hypothetical protein